MNRHPIVHPAGWLVAAALCLPGAAPAQRSSSSVTVEQILASINVRRGGTVCEIGAGDGEMSIAAARIVGPGGQVLASELGDARLRRLRDKIAAATLPQITVVPGDPGKTNFPAAACDGVFMRDVYHHLADPASMNLSIAASLKPGGRVAVIDFTPPKEEALRPSERAADGRHGVSPETVSREMKAADFEPVSSELPGQRWFFVVFAKPANASDK